jgi:hypothetical protein
MGYTHGTQWTDDKIKGCVLEVVNALKLDRMPSRRECEEYYQNTRLGNAVTRRCGGWYALAKELGLEMKKSETDFGKMYEELASDELRAMGFEVRRMTQNFPYDLLVDDCVKIDVKASCLYKGKQGSFYSYNLEKPFAVCDFFLLFAIDDNGKIARRMVVPSTAVVSNTQISVGEINSKYHCYTERFDLIEDASRFWSGLKHGESA